MMGYKNFREVYHKLAIVLDNGYCYHSFCMTEKLNLPMEVNSALVYGEGGPAKRSQLYHSA